ncbi:lipoyl protein ligase domain-containing protein [Sulfuracidifex metallicus]|uniref:Lipoate--protein ligase family protein n=1 Tax=Sulfuracidifex metallicus DSM 6482 = JCM 9184 TaxID=523847 RepID=A0A6A9QPJ2_SULME|nr:lipoate--protein ligase family protein [Sulfuracidifex metallicus]MUN29658.1 lipoate--protein ligase family protein [Sulfuracidifex metallicus DSM 6482 = JCM 9184]WOE49835.1 lipoate--protein ligase family protein [Sulfuracidifex metallicus DSM 6482 = JCM 9184]
MSWRYITLPPQDGYHMVTSFVSVADYVSNGGKNTLLLFNVKQPFVNVGVHQEVWLEVDLEYTKKMGIPVVRRDLGGGTVVITPGEQDFFLVVRHEDAPSSPSALYQKFLTPIVNVIRSYGIDATLKDQDIVVKGKKISGNGAMTRGKAVVITGNILLTLDVELMSKCIKVPSEKFRDKVAKDMRGWLTSIQDEIGYVPSKEELYKKIKEEFEKELNVKFEESNLTPEEIEEWDKLANEKIDEEWIYFKDNRHPDLKTERCVKINSSLALCHMDYKARKLLRITLRVFNKTIDEVSISGDFFVMSPQGFLERLEDALKGTPPSEVDRKIKEVFDKEKPVIFGFTQEDLIKAFQELISKPEIQEII